MKTRKLLLTLAAVLVFPAFLSSEEWVVQHSTYYSTSEQQKFTGFPAPPADGSRADKADLAAVLKRQQERTPADCARAGAGAHADYTEFFADISPFPLPLPERAAQIFNRVKIETDGVVVDVKSRFKRPRPFLRDSALDPCLGRIRGLAYPSGHATISRVFALLLSDLVPSGKKVFLARADQAALDRVIGGVHHPSDIEAGKKLADRLYGLYKKSPVFRADLETLKGLLAKEPAVK